MFMTPMFKGDGLIFKGEYVEIVVADNSKNFTEFDGVNNKLKVFANRVDDFNLKRVLVKDWYLAESKRIFCDFIELWSNKTSLFPASLKIKKMRSRWGSCNYIKKSITLNLELIKQKESFIEYVVLHEIAHLAHPNHGKGFHAFLKNHMPDYKLRRKSGRVNLNIEDFSNYI